ncbi:LpqB family beta-propeller domain-containing protein [Nocardioides conyzicola]|uniref:MtrAB system accessory lipoprotein LpqB n=1 Tax=Nocardioides conyzicola TaxID=1651781 RepID=A0ABP8WY24_9ACTN
MSRARARQASLVTVVVAAVALLAGCVSMPDTGPVVETQSRGGTSVEQGIYFNPRPPQEGDTRADIVRGFLVAMTATPIQTNTAREFLTKDAAAAWSPDSTVTYAGYPRVAETAAGVSVTLAEPDQLDSQGAWQGALPKSQRTIGFPMSFEQGEWRIDGVPDALIVPETWFARRFRQVSLYYFDPTVGTLVPEPVYVPGGKQLASTLTQALLLGPSDGLDRVVKSFVPPGLTLAPSVSISDGIADIALKGDEGQLSTESIELMMAQLAWTLRQDTRIEALRVSINGDPIPLPGGVSAYRVDGGSQYDPAGFQASPLLYGLRGGLLSSGTGGTLDPVSGPLGSTDLGLRSVGVSLTASTAAGVTADGSRVLMGPVSDTDDTPATTVVSGARDLLRPAWDFADRMWLIDRTAQGAEVSWVVDGKRHVLDVHGVTGARVHSFVVSRDGTRLVAVVRRGSGDELVVSRIAHNRRGRVLWATPARPIFSAADSDLPVRAIAWRNTTNLDILSPFPATKAVVQLRTASVDGSPAAEASSPPVEGSLLGLVGSPAVDEPRYGFNLKALVNLSAAGRRVIPLAADTTAITYVG